MCVLMVEVLPFLKTKTRQRGSYEFCDEPFFIHKLFVNKIYLRTYSFT